MDFNKDVKKVTSNIERESQKNSINDDQHAAVPTDPPPSYNEAVRINQYQDSSYPMPLPFASSLESNNAISHLNNDSALGDPPPTGWPNNARFQQWNNEATRILIINRSQMNDKFQTTKTSWETEILWNIILNDLLMHGYHFTIFDLMQYWSFLLRTYVSIFESVASGIIHSNWEYFPLMHQTFGSNVGSIASNEISDAGLSQFPVGAALPINNATSTITAMESSGVSDNLATTTALPNTNNVNGGDLSSEVLSSPRSASMIQLSSPDERIPLLLQNGGASALQPQALLKSSNVVTESALNPTPPSATTLIPASATLPNTTVVPAMMNLPSSETTQLTNTLELSRHDASVAAAAAVDPVINVPPSSASMLLETQASTAPVAINDSSSVWIKSDGNFANDTLFSLVDARPAIRTTAADQVAAGAGECGINVGPIDDLIKCAPPLAFSDDTTIVAATSGMTAITSQPIDVTTLGNVIDDNGVITTQPGINAINAVNDAYDDDYGCCDNCCESCCGDDFCCGDCYCEGGDCDPGDCGGC